MPPCYLRLMTWYPHLHRYFERSIWERPRHDLARPALILRRVSRYLYLVARGCFDDAVLVRAGALAYRSLLALVPFLALVFAVSKALGLDRPIFQDFLGRLVAGQERVSEILIRYVAATDLTALGAIGLAATLYVAVGIIGEAERALNEVWGVGKARSFRRKVSDYSGIVLVWPVLVLLSTALGTSAISKAIVRNPVAETAVEVGASLLPVFLGWAALAFLYYFLPNTAVSLRASVVGGVVAGTLWHAGQWAYVNFQVELARYNAIYGTFASVPIFLAWLHLSWTIALLGAEVAYAVQHEATYHPPVVDELLTVAATERAALRVLARSWSRFATGLTPLAASDFATALDLPRPLVVHAVEGLTAAGLVTVDARGALLPGRDLRDVGVGDLLMAFRHAGKEIEGPEVAGHEPECRELDARILAVHRAMEAGLRGVGAGTDLGDLVRPQGLDRPLESP